MNMEVTFLTILASVFEQYHILSMDYLKKKNTLPVKSFPKSKLDSAGSTDWTGFGDLTSDSVHVLDSGSKVDFGGHFIGRASKSWHTQ